MSAHAQNLLFQPGDDPFFQARDIALGDAQLVRHLLLGLLLLAPQAEAEGNDDPLPLLQLVQGPGQDDTFLRVFGEFV